MQQAVFTGLFLSMIAPFLYGQNRAVVHAWLEAQRFEDQQVVRAWCQNKTSSPLHIKYHSEHIFNGKKTIKKGALLAEPNQTALLSKEIHVFPSAEFDTIKLLLFHKKEKIFETQLVREPQIKNRNIAVPNLSPAKSEKKEESKPSAVLDAEIDGLVLDETRSKLAHDFYELFYNYWSAENIPTYGHTLVIREMPARIGIGSQVVVEVDGKRLTTLNLQPRGEVVENLAKQLTSALVTHFKDPNNFLDINSEDLNGSGIY